MSDYEDYDGWGENDYPTCAECGARLDSPRYSGGARWCWNCRSGDNSVKRGDAFPGKHLKAADVPDGFRSSVVVDRVDEEILGQGKDAEKKAVCYFVGKEKGLVLNVTNWNMLQMITGQEDSDNWRGARAVLFRTTTQYGADIVPALRLDAPPIGQPTARTVQPPPPPPPPVVDEAWAADDSDVPF